MYHWLALGIPPHKARTQRRALTCHMPSEAKTFLFHKAREGSKAHLLKTPSVGTNPKPDGARSKVLVAYQSETEAENATKRLNLPEWRRQKVDTEKSTSEVPMTFGGELPWGRRYATLS